jgi:hypothetical protein
MSAYARGMGIGRYQHTVKARREGRLGAGGLLRLAGTRKRQAGNSRVRHRRAGLAQTLGGSLAHRPHALFKRDPDVGRPRDALAEDGAARIRKARPASGPAAVNPEKK